MLPVVLMSAKSDKIRDHFVDQTGAMDAISKPFDAQALIVAIENALRRVSLGRVSASRLPMDAEDLEVSAATDIGQLKARVAQQAAIEDRARRRPAAGEGPDGSDRRPRADRERARRRALAGHRAGRLGGAPPDRRRRGLALARGRPRDRPHRRDPPDAPGRVQDRRPRHLERARERGDGHDALRAHRSRFNRAGRGTSFGSGGSSSKRAS